MAVRDFTAWMQLFVVGFFSCCTHWFLLLEYSLQGSILNFKICKEENKDYEDLC